MVEKINCGNCRYLNKNKKRKEGSKWYRYGCQNMDIYFEGIIA